MRAAIPGGRIQVGTAIIFLFLGLQVWGTPERCFDKVIDIQRRTGTEHFASVFSYGGMPYDISEHGMRPFAPEVLLELKRLTPTGDPVSREDRSGAAHKCRVTI